MTDPLPAGAAAAVSGTAGSLLFIGTATTLIRYGELTLLTDPNFLHQGQRAYLGYGLTAKRLTAPALTPEQLPELDLIVLSHLHGDHWDRQAQRGLDRQLPVITTPHASKRLQLRGFTRATGLRTWGSTELVKGDTRLRVTSMPGRHAPGLLRRVLPPVMGSLLEFGSLSRPVELRMYLTGDTLFVDDLREIPVRYPAIDAAVLHLGGTTLPGGLMVTMDAIQGADLLELIKPGLAIPVHYDDYRLFKSPLADFRAEVNRRGLGGLVRYVERGETVTLTGPAAG
ncbi:MAG TPA: MBL fold metallo-hydrolase [Jatrophihabitans sp.]|jgi:L-ascorbate metabolism protein UlaG (beta-lactamase superfamily)|uniref:MBL fold metallo-hydrolase n=1 Tax=Jatrophihabitans sp. TaxID=1932789 RepID=UPI002EF7B08F